MWSTLSLKQAMGNSSSMGKHRKAQRQHPTHHPHSWAGVTAAQEGARMDYTEPSAQQIRANSENYNFIKFAKTDKPGQPPTAGHLKIRNPIQDSAVTAADFAA